MAKKIQIKQLKKIPILAKAVIFLLIIYAALKLVSPPLPSNLISMYMVLAICAIILYISVRDERIGEFIRPIRTVFQEKDKATLRIGILVIFPLLVGLIAYPRLAPSGVEPPAELRVIHPAPPTQIEFRGKTIKIVGLENPFRDDKENFEKYVNEGAKVYFSNCVFCHGPKLDGKGIFEKGFNPPPADFTDTGTIAQLQESYLFWRISKGGPGLPRESYSWNSAMPIWENFLTEEEIWKVIMYLYEGAGVSPRTWE